MDSENWNEGEIDGDNRLNAGDAERVGDLLTKVGDVVEDLDGVVGLGVEMANFIGEHGSGRYAERYSE